MVTQDTKVRKKNKKVLSKKEYKRYELIDECPKKEKNCDKCRIRKCPEEKL